MFNGSVFNDNMTSVPARDVRVIQCPALPVVLRVQCTLVITWIDC